MWPSLLPYVAASAPDFSLFHGEVIDQTANRPKCRVAVGQEMLIFIFRWAAYCGRTVLKCPPVLDRVELPRTLRDFALQYWDLRSRARLSIVLQISRCTVRSMRSLRSTCRHSSHGLASAGQPNDSLPRALMVSCSSLRQPRKGSLQFHCGSTFYCVLPTYLVVTYYVLTRPHSPISATLAGTCKCLDQTSKVTFHHCRTAPR